LILAFTSSVCLGVYSTPFPQAGIPCTDACRCTGCQNKPDSEALKALQNSAQKAAATSSAAATGGAPWSPGDGMGLAMPPGSRGMPFAPGIPIPMLHSFGQPVTSPGASLAPLPMPKPGVCVMC
jgi:hypothetical protein